MTRTLIPFNRYCRCRPAREASAARAASFKWRYRKMAEGRFVSGRIQRSLTVAARVERAVKSGRLLVWGWQAVTPAPPCLHFDDHFAETFAGEEEFDRIELGEELLQAAVVE